MWNKHKFEHFEFTVAGHRAQVANEYEFDDHHYKKNMAAIRIASKEGEQEVPPEVFRQVRELLEAKGWKVLDWSDKPSQFSAETANALLVFDVAYEQVKAALVEQVQGEGIPLKGSASVKAVFEEVFAKREKPLSRDGRKAVEDTIKSVLRDAEKGGRNRVQYIAGSINLLRGGAVDATEVELSELRKGVGVALGLAEGQLAR